MRSPATWILFVLTAVYAGVLVGHELRDVRAQGDAVAVAAFSPSVWR